jgi:hypothetical protein
MTLPPNYDENDKNHL